MKTTRRPLEFPHEEIAARARDLWQTAGSPAHRDMEFWLAAEAELQRDRSQTRQTADQPPVKRASRENERRA